MHRFFAQVPSRLRNYLPVAKKQQTAFISQLCNGEAHAWEQLLDHWSPRLYSYVSYNAATEEDVRRLLRLIISELIQTLVGTRPIDNLTTLIFAIAYQHVLRYRRQIPDPLASRGGQRYQRHTTSDELPQSFIQHFRQFSPEMQQILLLRYLCGVTVPELAEIVGQPEELLTKVLYRTRFYRS